MSLNLSLFTTPPSTTVGTGQLAGSETSTVACPNCSGEVAQSDDWQRCPYCDKRLQVRVWPVIRHSTNAAAAMPDQATCFFHPDKVFQACCQRCGRFVCALCDLQLGAEHVCPTCFERGRVDTGLNGGKAEWRYCDVLWDSIALTIGLGWVVIWPVIFLAIPIAISLHVKYRKAPRSYLIPRSPWRFWVAYAGFVWLPLLILSSLYIPRWMAGRH